MTAECFMGVEVMLFASITVLKLLNCIFTQVQYHESLSKHPRGKTERILKLVLVGGHNKVLISLLLRKLPSVPLG